ncbi:MAG: glycosyltransferase family 2 protein [bacterium]
MTSARDQEFLVLIPALDAESTLPELLPLVIKVVGQEHVVVIDDGSTDRTSDVAAACGVRVLRHTANRGKGRALVTGLQFACSDGYGFAVTMDADGQHLPREIPQLMRLARPGRIVVGRRSMKQGEMPIARRLSNFLTSLLVSILSGVRVRDSQCGFRVLPVQVAKLGPWSARSFDWETEVLIVATRQGFRVSQTGVTTVYGRGSSHIRHLGDTVRFAMLIARRLLTR